MLCDSNQDKLLYKGIHIKMTSSEIFQSQVRVACVSSLANGEAEVEGMLEPRPIQAAEPLFQMTKQKSPLLMATLY